MKRNRMITSAIAAEILGFSASYVRRLLLTGKLKGERMGHDWILSTLDVERFKAKRTKKPKELKADENQI